MPDVFTAGIDQLRDWSPERIEAFFKGIALVQEAARGEPFTPPDAGFLAWLPSYWQACGPWVPEGDLSETGRAIRAAFVELFEDARIIAWLKETGRV